ncbi:hypothetical protein GCM10010168_27550 [Actinoplanes ianthinogenes]|uniref:Secreted protein n=1 Tax=Actinoplanes ianthinogenes TaxID=122358 RepID=A0ABN6C5S6_9ACTN|nr:hypothetical protein [Actinoplanes ianthinogenes]BCJ39896.1 hypothetical protein Aiant_05530 [Actinoplanes ianthinogenes]GGR08846.1 hypothetical protein GCM10010168_27550 [Actinoplanes ianthinogenes]
MKNGRWVAGVGLGVATLAFGTAVSAAGGPEVAVAAGGGDRAAAFTACVRANGVADFPGVTITADGRVRVNGSVSVLADDYRKAVAACRELLPSGSALPAEPELSAPSGPSLGFTCAGTCPKAPAAPARPS